MNIPKYEVRINSSMEVYLAESGFYKIDGRRVYNNPSDLSEFFGDVIGIRNAADEYVYVACLDTKCHIVSCFEASHGSCNASIFPIREILQKALIGNAVNIVVGHNHPSGDYTPSSDDITATDRLVKAGDIVGIKVLDHIIVAANTDGYYSFKVCREIK